VADRERDTDITTTIIAVHVTFNIEVDKTYIVHRIAWIPLVADSACAAGPAGIIKVWRSPHIISRSRRQVLAGDWLTLNDTAAFPCYGKVVATAAFLLQNFNIVLLSGSQ